MPHGPAAARIGAQTAAGGVAVVADGSAAGSPATSRAVPDAAQPRWLVMAARIHQDPQDTP
jgi:hypothetical protein